MKYELRSMKWGARFRSVLFFLFHSSYFLFASLAHAQNPEIVHPLQGPYQPSVAATHVFSPVSKATQPLRAPTAAVSTPWTAAGREFYGCFLSVVGSAEATPDSKVRALMISSRAPTRVTVELLRSAYRVTVMVTPGTMTRIDLPDYAALGRDDYELAEPKVLHIYSNDIITVYGFAHNYLSSDGFVVYPTQTLGTSYMVMSARNAVNYDLGDGSPNPRSECAIVATQDNTRVSFTLSATSYSGRLLADSTYSIQLNRGEVYQIMARDTGIHLTAALPDRSIDWWNLYAPWTSGPDCDLTGSYITSDKPIAVFSGHERATAPTILEYDFSNPETRDHLAEQMVPLSCWGKQFIIASSGQDFTAGRRIGGDVVRILSASDSAHIKVNGKLSYTLGRGQHCDFMSDASPTMPASFIESDRPVLVAHFMQSSNTGTDGMGDPDLTLVRPLDQFTNNYTLPGWHDGSIFTEPHLLVVCDTSATLSTHCNGVPLRGALWNRIPGTSFTCGVFGCQSGEQHIESPLPCYAESFAFGPADSYTYAGGGDYAYIDSLFSVDLNFRAVPLGQARNLTSPLHSSITPLAADTVTIYGYEWVSGDTANFDLLDGIVQPLSIAPLGQLPVPFRFHPDSMRSYSAILRVWSSAVNPVFIHVQGNGIKPIIKVFPDTIDFGRVRVGKKRDSLFTIQNIGNSKLELTDLDYTTSLQLTDFTADTLKGTFLVLDLDPAIAVQDSVFFKPMHLGLQVGRIPIDWTDPSIGVMTPPVVVLLGTGIAPDVISSGHDFGRLRVDSASSPDTVAIVNRGSDATAIDSVTIVDSNALSDFFVTLDTLPPAGSHKLSINLNYEGSDTALRFVVQFQPRSLGAKTLVVRIHTVDGAVIFDTFTGVGVEPLVLVTPQMIDFGTITVQANTTQLLIDSPFVVTNSGSMAGKLDTLLYHDTAHFTVTLDKPFMAFPEALDTGKTFRGTASFRITEEGDFVDTVYVRNDTRYRLYDTLKNYVPMLVLKAKVRTGPIDTASVNFGVIATCDPDTNDLVLHNPYPVEVHIDSIALISDTAGFSYGKENFLFPINIQPDSNYRLHLVYAFPPDSLNGPQHLKLVLFQRRGGGEARIGDTMTADLIRKQRVFTLLAHLPGFASSANDISKFKLPITVEGPRAGVTELNSWTLTLHFSNDLFEPIGIDTTGALAVRGDSTFTITTHWDQATRTYSIIVTGSAVSDSAKIANNLLLSILMQAYLTTDTTVTVTPTFTWAQHPCAYNLQSFTLSIPYADECGDKTLRKYMLNETPLFTLTPVWPNPVDRSIVGDAGGVSIGYNAAEALQLTSTIFSESGEEIGRSETNVAKGAGALTLPARLLPRSGPAFVRIEAVSSTSNKPFVQTVKIEVTK